MLYFFRDQASRCIWECTYNQLCVLVLMRTNYCCKNVIITTNVVMPPYINCPHQGALLHQASPSALPYINCPHQHASYICCPHESAPLHQASPSVPPYINSPHQSATLYQRSLSECHLISNVPIRVPPYINCPNQTGSWIS